MSSTIILCSDGSDLAIRAVSAGLALLRPADRVIVAAVVDAVDFSLAHDASGHAGASATEAELEAQHRALLAEGQAILEQTTAVLGVENVETRVLEGRPGPALCELASEVAAQAVVLGSRGRGGVKRALLGSVSDHVVRNAPCPVVVTGDIDGARAS